MKQKHCETFMRSRCTGGDYVTVQFDWSVTFWFYIEKCHKVCNGDYNDLTIKIRSIWVMKRFQHYKPFVSEIHGSLVDLVWVCFSHMYFEYFTRITQKWSSSAMMLNTNCVSLDRYQLYDNYMLTFEVPRNFAISSCPSKKTVIDKLKWFKITLNQSTFMKYVCWWPRAVRCQVICRYREWWSISSIIYI